MCFPPMSKFYLSEKYIRSKLVHARQNFDQMVRAWFCSILYKQILQYFGFVFNSRCENSLIVIPVDVVDGQTLYYSL